MSLRKKNLIWVAVVFTLLSVILQIVYYFTISNSFNKLEKDEAYQEVERAEGLLSDRIDTLGTTNSDWSAWSETYNFVETGDAGYIERNLMDNTFVTLNINILLIVKSSGDIIFGKAYDLQKEAEVPVPQSIKEYLSAGNILVHHQDTDSYVAGIISMPEGPLMVTSRPVLTSEREGPIHAALIMGRYLNDAEVQDMEKLTGVPLSIHMLNDPQPPSDLKAVLPSLSDGSPIAVHPLDGDVIAGYALVKDIYGHPLLVLQSDMPRDIYHQGQRSMNILLISRIVLVIIFAVFSVFILERFVLSRLIRLRKAVNDVTFGNGPSVRVPVTGNDEITSLGQNVNEMLDRLEESYSREYKLRLERETEIERRARFTRALVHELKTPMTPIAASSDLLLEELKEEPLLSLARNVNRGVHTLNQRVDELLDIARGELKMLEIDRKEINPLLLLQLVGEEEVPVASKRGQLLNVELPSSLLPVWADENRLRQVLFNIINNAVKFTPEGGMITLRARDEDEDLIVEVQDSGPGIPAENKQMIFDAYYRLNDDNKHNGGLGLGLAICKIIVELHGGRIWVQSETEKGSTFGFTIPHRPPQDQSPAKTT